MSSLRSGPAIIRPPSSIYPDCLPAGYSFLATPSVSLRINFRHPAYEPGDDLLFTLYAWDFADGGLHHGLAHTACAIVAANRHDGYLAETRTGPPISAGVDNVLAAGDYYYHVPWTGTDPSPSSPYRYPVVPSFQDWRFPPSIPEAWTRPYYVETAFYTSQQSSVTSAVRARDTTCRISDHFTGTEVAHLCPEHEQEWFLRNSMAMWNTNLSLDPDNLLNDLSNVLLLRSDLHKAFDDRKFVFFPKARDGYVVHMLEPTPDIGQLYHNTRVHPLLQCNPRLLYARFAWALFPSLSAFLSKPNTPRFLVVAKNGEAGAEWIEEVVARPEQLRAKISASRSRSPKKRQRAAETDPHDTVESNDCVSRQSKRRCTSHRHSLIERSGVTTKPQTEMVKQQNLGFDKQFSDYEQAHMELEEDLELQRKHLDPTSLQQPPSWYPGWRRIQRLKDNWISLGRPPEFGKSLNESSNRDHSRQDVHSDPRYILEAMGLDNDYDTDIDEGLSVHFTDMHSTACER